MTEILHREFVYLWRYFELQLRQIAFYWILSMAIGSAVSVFAKDGIHRMFRNLRNRGVYAHGPAMKITNLGAVKIVLGAKNFALYWAFTILFALLTGWVVNIIL